MNDYAGLASIGATDRLARASSPGATVRPDTVSTAPSEDFALAMGAEAGKAQRSAAAVGEGEAPGKPVVQTARHESREVPPLEKFEAFVLRSFVESMLPQENSSFFGTGTAGNIWRSMLAEQLGGELARDGGVGIADILRSRGVASGAADGQMAKVEATLGAHMATGFGAGDILGPDDSGL